ncbi:MAG: DUF3179 domain-containing protein [Nitrospirales bacterium]
MNELKNILTRYVSVLGVGLLLLIIFGFSSPPSQEFDFTKHNVPLDQIFSGGPSKDGIPAILKPVFIKAADATHLNERDRILGLVEGTEAKAYPIKILNWHEIVNDSFAGKPVVVTYCPLCGTGIAFYPMVNERQLTFGVSGLLYQSDMVMYDHQTESLWSQISMEAIAGPMTGSTLPHIFLDHTTWGEWHEAHPTTLVLSTQTGVVRDYQRDPYLGYAKRADLLFPVNHKDSRLPTKAWVLGLKVGEVTKAYPFSELKKTETPIHDFINGQRVKIQFNAETQSTSALDASGKPLPTIQAFWFAWYAFHPQTEIYSIPQ